MMKNLAMSFLVWALLALAALALARVSQLLSPRVGWPLIVLLAGGGLGGAALFFWRQQLVRSWPLFLSLVVLAGVFMAAAEHFFQWRDAIAATLVRQEEAIRKEPRIAAIIEQQIPVPTWSEYMTPATDEWKTWAWWIGDAAAKLGVALAILILGSQHGWLANRETTGETR